MVPTATWFNDRMVTGVVCESFIVLSMIRTLHEVVSSQLMKNLNLSIGIDNSAGLHWCCEAGLALKARDIAPDVPAERSNCKLP
jgi:hypothetical protein